MNAPYSPPVFTEGAILPPSPTILDTHFEKSLSIDERVELEDTGIIRWIPPPRIQQNESYQRQVSNPTDSYSRTSELLSVASTAGAAVDLESKPSSSAHISPNPSSPSKLLGKTLPRLTSTPRESNERVAVHQDVCSQPYSMICEEEEDIFPTRKWTKPLANMGDAFSWRLSVSHRFNAIQY